MAATTSPKTGHGASLTFGTSGTALTIQQIQVHTKSRAKVPIPDLSLTTFMKYLAGDLIDPGEVTVQYYHENDQEGAPFAAAETITVTFRQETGETAAAKYEGTGFVLSDGGHNLNTDDPRLRTCVIAFDGGTGPTYTAAT